ncbi:MAG TPA: hypothetical protein DIC30_06685 [Oceanospirillales bacterium]|nr:hypothetical protein [Oleispira sp.]HCM05680.1 hypothetical protein [Oceanospirillales bacterium]
MKVIALIGLMLLSLVSRAESNTDQFVQFKISSLQLFSSFSSFIYFQGDDRNRARLQNAKEQGDIAVAALPGTETSLKTKWKQITDYVDLYQSYDFDGVDMSLEGGWSILQNEFNKIIDTRAESKISTIDEFQIRMETILSQYMAYANSTTGGYGVSSSGVPLDKQIDDMTKELAALAEKSDKYKPLQKRWNYIQGTLLAYNSNVAPYVVLHTFEGMRKMIASY